MLLLDPVWSIYEQSRSEIVSCFEAMMRSTTQEIDAGPAGEAERDGLPVRVDNGVAVIPVMGAMIRRSGRFARFFGFAGTDQIRLAIESAIADAEVERILLRIDSPGGSVSGIQQLADVVANSTKPTTAVVEGMAASAAYWVASQADSIVVDSTDLLGSIGVRMMLYDWSESFKQEGVKAIPIDTGEFKSAGATGTKITEAQIADFQRIVDQQYALFVDAVASGRSLDRDVVLGVADGRIFTATEALDLGLADKRGTFGETLRGLRSRRGRSTETARARLRL